MLGAMHELPVAAGDAIFVPAGTTHAIGADILIGRAAGAGRLLDLARVGRLRAERGRLPPRPRLRPCAAGARPCGRRRRLRPRCRPRRDRSSAPSGCAAATRSTPASRSSSGSRARARSPPRAATSRSGAARWCSSRTPPGRESCAATSGRYELPGVHDPGRVAALLDRAQQLDAERARSSAASHGAWSRPTAWWWVIVPPAATIASRRRAPSARATGRPGRSASWRAKNGEVQRRARRIQVRDVAADEQRRAQRRRATARVQPREVRPRRRRLQRLDHHAAVEQVVAQVRPGEARGAPGAAGARGRPSAPAARSSDAARASRRRAAARASPSQPADQQAAARRARALAARAAARPCAGERERHARLGARRTAARRRAPGPPARARAARRSRRRSRGSEASPRSGAPRRRAARAAPPR